MKLLQEANERNNALSKELEEALNAYHKLYKEHCRLEMLLLCPSCKEDQQRTPTVKPLYCVRIVTTKLLRNPESMGCGPTPSIGLDHILNRIRCLLACCRGKIVVKQSDMCDGKGEQPQQEKSNVRRFCCFG